VARTRQKKHSELTNLPQNGELPATGVEQMGNFFHPDGVGDKGFGSKALEGS
jgi:hypothetical protein